MRIFKKYFVFIIVCFFLASFPFFWLQSGDVYMGGDGGRAYFYEPFAMLKNVALYYLYPLGTGEVSAKFFYIPFILLQSFLKIFISSTAAVTLHHVFKIVTGFVAVFLILQELIPNRKIIKEKLRIALMFSSIMGGLLYIFNPAMIENYVVALPSHDQVALNPLMFYLILKFFLTNNFKYLWIALAFSLIFAHNFSYFAAPPIFSFYPLAFLFIGLYTKFICKSAIPWKKICIGLLLFALLHSFHLVPQLHDVFDSSNLTTSQILDQNSMKDSMGYFFGVLGIPKISYHFLAYSPNMLFLGGTILFPMLLILGLLLSKKDRTLLLLSCFYLLAFYMYTAKVSNLGVEIYKNLFYIPGFTMFRNFYGQWQFTYYFYFSLLFGYTVFYVLSRLQKKYFIVLTGFLLFFIPANSWNFINGNLVNAILADSHNTRIAMDIEPNYKIVQNILKNEKVDGNVLLLPFTDSSYQVLHGTTHGAFVGRSILSQVTGKKDFAGYMDMLPFSSVFLNVSKEKDYSSIRTLLGALNIRYVYFNSDKRIYDDFSGSPFAYVKQYMPQNQELYKDYIKNITGKLIVASGTYSLYTTRDEYYMPIFYTSREVTPYADNKKVSIYDKALAFFPSKNTDKMLPTFIEHSDCRKLFAELCAKKNIAISKENPTISFQKINPIKYKVHVDSADAPFLLIFLNSYNKGWKVLRDHSRHSGQPIKIHQQGKIIEEAPLDEFLDSKTFETSGATPLPENQHAMVNGFANAWLITPKDISRGNSFIIEFAAQQNFYIASAVSLISLLFFLFWGFRMFVYKKLLKFISRR